MTTATPFPRGVAEYPPDGLVMYVVYENTKDFPDEIIVRRWVIRLGRMIPDPALHHRGTTLESARESIPNGLYRIPQQASDDPVIVETWL